MPDQPTPVVTELGFRTAADGDAVVGRGEVYAGACVPGTDALRTSVLATWADIVNGAVAGLAVDPRVPLTLDLEVQVPRPARLGEHVVATAVSLKTGRSVVVTESTFHEERSGDLVGVALASFMVSPDPSHVFPDGFPVVLDLQGRLTQPLAERIGATSPERGVAEVPRRPDGLNATGAIQGGLLALAAEEAASSLAEGPVLLDAMSIRYMRPFRIGPARAVATGDAHRAVVHITDAGSGNLGAVVTTHGRPLDERPAEGRNI